MMCDIEKYMEDLYEAETHDQAFSVFESQIQRLGFDAALYTFIPDLLIGSDSGAKPLYQVSDSYVPDYVKHYQEARYDKSDPLIKAILDGVSAPIIWSGQICETYMSHSRKSREVIQESRSYGVRNAITLPLESGPRGIAGASFVVTESCSYDPDMEKRTPELRAVTRMYHTINMSKNGFYSRFVLPAFGGLRELEILFLAGLSEGKSIKQMAVQLSRSQKYLEQVLMHMRIGVGGRNEEGKPAISRDQLLYHAGQVDIISIAAELKQRS